MLLDTVLSRFLSNGAEDDVAVLAARLRPGDRHTDSKPATWSVFLGNGGRFLHTGMRVFRSQIRHARGVRGAEYEAA